MTCYLFSDVEYISKCSAFVLSILNSRPLKNSIKMEHSLIQLAIILNISQYEKDSMACGDLSLISTNHAGSLHCEWKFKYWTSTRLKETTSKISSNFCKKFREKNTFHTKNKVFCCHLNDQSLIK